MQVVYGYYCCLTSDSTLTTAVSEGSVRLVGGSDAHEGRLELYKLGHWGTVCNLNWDLADATVVCHQLGYTLALSLPTRTRYGRGSGVIWLYNVTCTGYEEELTNCNNSGVGVHYRYCSSHTEDVGIECSSEFTTDYMLCCIQT